MTEFPLTQCTWPAWDAFCRQMQEEVAARPGESTEIRDHPVRVWLPRCLWTDYLQAADVAGLTTGQLISYLVFIGARAVAEEAQAARFNDLTQPEEAETIVEPCGAGPHV
jgi:hypothetical protein